MGRYDYIKVYKDGTWVTPTRLRVYNNGWLDFGAADSTIKNNLYAFKSSNVKVAMLANRVDTTTTLDSYIKGKFSLLPASGYCYCPKSTDYGSHAFNFNCTIRKTSDVDQVVFHTYHKSNTKDFFKITWQADGKIRVDADYSSGTTRTFTSSNAVKAGTWVNLRVYANKGSYNCYIVFNGTTTSKTLYSSFITTGAVNYVGDTYLNFKDTLTVTGVKHGPTAYTASFNASTEEAETAQHTALTRVVDTQTVTSYVRP